jgi:hypothetical protein
MKSLLLSSLYLLTVFLVSNNVFDPANLYYELWWLDIPMHLIGGFGVAWFAASLLRLSHKHVSYQAIILSLLCVAVVWELYEYIRDVVAYHTWNGWFDTIKDTINGVIGASIWYYVYNKNAS